MKIEDIRQLRIEELHLELERMRRHWFDLRSQSVTEKLENPHQLRNSRKDIARVLTVLHERGEKNIEQEQHHLEAKSARAEG